MLATVSCYYYLSVSIQCRLLSLISEMNLLMNLLISLLQLMLWGFSVHFFWLLLFSYIYKAAAAAWQLGFLLQAHDENKFSYNCFDVKNS